MPSELPPDLRSAVHQSGGPPLHLFDPDTNTDYVLIPASSYRSVDGSQTADELADTYTAQFAAAIDAGWGDPEMSEYDDYDTHRAKP